MKHPPSKRADLANEFDRLKQSATPFCYDVAAASGAVGAFSDGPDEMMEDTWLAAVLKVPP
jgi:hypothetical protein